MQHSPRMRTSVSRYHRNRFPAEIVSHCVWLYFRFALSFRDVEEMLAMRGVSEWSGQGSLQSSVLPQRGSALLNLSA